jgi:hypothetical protein
LQRPSPSHCATICWTAISTCSRSRVRCVAR